MEDLMAELLRRYPGLDPEKIARLDYYQIKYVYLRPKKTADQPPQGAGPGATADSYVEFYRKLGLSPAEALAKARALAESKS